MESIIYYPYINMEDSVLLRSSILYWDKLRTIIPGDFYRNALSNELLYLEDNGIYEPINPINFFNSSSYRDFEEEFLYRINLRDKRKNFKNNLRRERANIKSETIKWPKFNLYESKMANSLINRLRDMGYIKEININGIVMDQDVAILYMSILAKFLASYERRNSNERYSIGTTEPTFFSKPYNTRNFNFGHPKELCINYILSDILPVPKSNIPLADIIWFRREYEFELKKLRVQIKEFEKQLKQCSLESDFNDVCYECREKIELESLKISKLMEKSKIEYCMSSVKALFEIDKSFIPAVLGVFSAKYCSNELGLTIFGGMALSLKAVKMYYDNRKEIIDNPYSYLYFAKKNNVI